MNITKNAVTLMVTAAICAASFSVYAVKDDNDVKDDWDITTVCGDLDGDESVTVEDLIIMRKYVAGIIGDSDFNYEAADMDGDKTVDTNDLILLRRKIAGL